MKSLGMVSPPAARVLESPVMVSAAVKTLGMGSPKVLVCRGLECPALVAATWSRASLMGKGLKCLLTLGLGAPLEVAVLGRKMLAALGSRRRGLDPALATGLSRVIAASCLARSCVTQGFASAS